jgi:hypothetical protein
VNTERCSNSGDRPLPPDGRAAPAPTYKLAAVCLLLLGVTWLPLLGIHVNRMWEGDASTGTLLVVFSPALSSGEFFQKVLDAKGAPVTAIPWFRHAWVVQSREPGFAGRLRAQGAWAVFSPDLLSAQALFDCFRISPSS